MKRKIIFSCILLAVFTVFALHASYNLNYLLLRERNMCSINPIILIQGLNDSRIRTFLILFFIVGALLIIYMLFVQNYIKYKSDMQQITPELETPKAEGQGQYGTAKWLSKAKYEKVFAVAEMDDRSALIKDLVAHGRDDKKTNKDCEEQDGGDAV